MVCQGYKHKLWWRGRLMMWAALQHDTDRLQWSYEVLLSLAMMMTFIYTKPRLSNRMIFCDRPCITVILTVCCAGQYTFVHHIPYQYFHQPHDHNVLRRCRMIGFGACLVSPLLSCWQAREGMPCNSSLPFNCFTPCGRIEQWMDGVWVNGRVEVLGTHNVTKNCWQGHVGQKVKHFHEYLMLSSSIRFTAGFCSRLWLSYAGCQMTS